MSITLNADGLRSAPTRAVFYMVSAIALQIMLDASVKWLTEGYTVMQIAFIRYVFTIVIATMIAARAGGLETLKTKRPGAHLLRSGLNLATMLTFYLALSLLPLADAIAISFAAPLFMTALSGPLLGERVGLHRWSAVLIGLGGVVLILQPGGAGFTPGALLALASALFYALSLISSRQMSRTENSHNILFYYSVTVLAVAGTTGILGETALLPDLEWSPLRMEDLWIFVIVGCAGSACQFFFNQAFRYGEVSMLAPLEYTALLWGIAYGLIIWGDLPSPIVLAGAAVVACSSLYIARREAKAAAVKGRATSSAGEASATG